MIGKLGSLDDLILIRRPMVIILEKKDGKCFEFKWGAKDRPLYFSHMGITFRYDAVRRTREGHAAMYVETDVVPAPLTSSSADWKPSREGELTIDDIRRLLREHLEQCGFFTRVGEIEERATRQAAANLSQHLSLERRIDAVEETHAKHVLFNARSDEKVQGQIRQGDVRAEDLVEQMRVQDRLIESMVNEIVGFRQLVESVAKLERGVKILEACQAEFNKGVDRRFEVLEREAKARRDGQTLQAQAQASHDKRLTRRVNKIEREVQTLDPGWAGTGADADVYSTSVTEHASLGDEPRIHDASAKPVSDDEAAIRRHFHEQRMGVTPQTSVPKEFADALAFDQAVMDTGPAHIKIEQKGPAYAKVHFGSAEAKVPYSAITLGVDDKAGYWYKIRIDIDVRGFLRATYEAAE